ncbi:MAG: ABC transporter permease [Halobacteriales archaeon]
MRGALPVAGRILWAMRRDRRTLGLVLAVPAVIVWLLSEVFERPELVAPILLGVIVFFLTYLLTSVGFLRERTAGTMERVLAAPVTRSGLVVGYVTGYGVLAVLQSTVLLVAGVAFLDVTFEHGVVLFFLIELLGALTALGIGIVLSLFARSEFQVVQFIPVVITPQVVLGGTFLPVSDLPIYLELPARVMPLTYLLSAMDYVVLGEGSASDLRIAVAVLAGFTLLSIMLASVSVKRG